MIKEKIVNFFNKSKKEKKSVRIIDLAISVIIGLIFFLCPLFFTGMPFQGPGFEKLHLFFILSLLAFVLWISKAFFQEKIELKRSIINWPILVLALIFIFSAIFSVSFRDSVLGSFGNPAKSLVAMFYFIMFYFVFFNNADENRIKISFWSFIASASLIAVYSLLQILNIFILPFEFAKSSQFNPMGSVSSLTMFCLALIPLFVIAASQLEKIHPNIKRQTAIFIKIFLSAVTLVNMAILFILSGFTFWYAGILGMVIILMFFLSKIIEVDKKSLVIPAFVLVVLIGFSIFGNLNLIKTNVASEVSLSRDASWQIAKESLKQNPILGSGPSTFYYSFSNYKSNSFNNTPFWDVSFDSASGVLFELLSTVGILGVLAFLAVILLVIYNSFMALMNLKNTGNKLFLLAFFSSAITILFLILLFPANSSILLIAYLIIIMSLISSSIISLNKKNLISVSLKTSAKNRLAFSAFFILVCIGFLGLFSLEVKAYLADIKAKQAVLAVDFEEKINKINSAIKLFPYQDRYYLEFSNHILEQANKEIEKNELVKSKEYMDVAIEKGTRALILNPNKPLNIKSLALVYENALVFSPEYLDMSKQLYERLTELDPNSPLPNFKLALIDMAGLDFSEETEENSYKIKNAILNFDKAIEKKNDFAPAHYAKAIASEKIGNEDEAISSLEKAVFYDQYNGEYQFEIGRLYFNKGMANAELSRPKDQPISSGDAVSDDFKNEQLEIEGTVDSLESIEWNQELRKAEEYLLKALSFNTENPNVLYSLGLLYTKVGEKENAKIAVDALLKVVTDEEQVQVLKEQFVNILK